MSQVQWRNEKGYRKNENTTDMADEKIGLEKAESVREIATSWFKSL